MTSKSPESEHPGNEGNVGNVGEPGSAGSGGRGGHGGRGGVGRQGERGATGPANKSDRHRLIALFILLLLAFGLLAYRSETGQRSLRHSQHDLHVAEQKINTNTALIRDTVFAQAKLSYEGCMTRRTNTIKLNRTTNATIAFLSSIHPRPVNLQKFITVYRSALLTLPHCSLPPVR